MPHTHPPGRRSKGPSADKAGALTSTTQSLSEGAAVGLFIESVEDYAILALDVDGRVISWNSGAERIKGYKESEVLGKPFSIFFSPEDIQRGLPQQLVSRAAAEGRAVDEGTRLRKDGSRFSAHAALTAVRDKQGVLRGFVEVTRDVSDRKLIEQELRESEERFRSFTLNFPGLAWIADSRGVYRFVNRNLESAYQRPTSEWLGKSPDQLFGPEAAKMVNESNAQVVESGQPLQVIEKVGQGAGTRHFLVNRFPIKTSNETLIGGLSIDISQRVRAEEELRWLREERLRQERIRSIAQLSSGLAHDLNNTMNAMSLKLSLIKADRSYATDANLDQLARFVSEASDRVRRLQEFARLHREPLLHKVDLAQVIRGAIDAAGPTLRGGSELDGAEVRVSLELPDLPSVFGSQSDLQQIFATLFVNACQAMPSGGTIEVEAHAVAGHVQVSVADRGSGIPVEHLGRIFDPFFSTREKGGGLGLSLASAVMARLGGSIGASNRVGGGAVFMLTFPIAEEAVPPEWTTERRTVRSVLVIDDDLDNLYSIDDALRFRNYEVSIASSGPEAIAILRSGAEFDCVICDIGMPDMSGWEVATKIRQIRPGLKVYMLSGWANEISTSDPRRKFVADVLAKPIDLDRMDTILNR